MIYCQKNICRKEWNHGQIDILIGNIFPEKRFKNKIKARTNWQAKKTYCGGI